MKIALGADYGGPELQGQPIDMAITRVMRLFAQGGYRTSEGPGINVVFCVPGSLSKPSFSEVHKARFSKKMKLIRVNVPVPEDIKTDDLEEFIFESIGTSVRVAEPVFKKAGIPFSIEEALKLIAEAKQRLVH